MKRLLAPLSAAGLIAMIVSVVVIVGPGYACISLFTDNLDICPPITSISVLLGVLLLFAGLALAALAWIFGLGITAENRQWGWFFLILILNVLGVLAYAWGAERV
jgi:hypothetical protein